MTPQLKNNTAALCSLRSIAWRSLSTVLLCCLMAANTDAVDPPASICSREGFFRNPDDCTRFYRCVDNRGTARARFTIYHFDCAEGSVFDERIQVCNFPGSAPPCFPGDSIISGSTPVASFPDEPQGGVGLPVVPGGEGVLVVHPGEGGHPVVVRPPLLFPGDGTAPGLVPGDESGEAGIGIGIPFAPPGELPDYGDDYEYPDPVHSAGTPGGSPAGNPILVNPGQPGRPPFLVPGDGGDLGTPGRPPAGGSGGTVKPPFGAGGSKPGNVPSNGDRPGNAPTGVTPPSTGNKPGGGTSSPVNGNQPSGGNRPTPPSNGNQPGGGSIPAVVTPINGNQPGGGSIPAVVTPINGNEPGGGNRPTGATPPSSANQPGGGNRPPTLTPPTTGNPLGGGSRPTGVTPPSNGNQPGGGGGNNPFTSVTPPSNNGNQPGGANRPTGVTPPVTGGTRPTVVTPPSTSNQPGAGSKPTGVTPPVSGNQPGGGTRPTVVTPPTTGSQPGGGNRPTGVTTPPNGNQPGGGNGPIFVTPPSNGNQPGGGSKPTGVTPPLSGGSRPTAVTTPSSGTRPGGGSRPTDKPTGAFTPTVTPTSTPEASGEYETYPQSIFACPSPGFFPYEHNCHEFYVCQEVLPGKLLADQLYRCPKRYLFDEDTSRCQREEKVNCRKFGVDSPSSYGKQGVLVVLEMYLDKFFGTPLRYEETRRRFGYGAQIYDRRR